MSSGEDGGMLGLCSGNQCWTGGSGVQARPSTPPPPSGCSPGIRIRSGQVFGKGRLFKLAARSRALPTSKQHGGTSFLAWLPWPSANEEPDSLLRPDLLPPTSCSRGANELGRVAGGGLGREAALLLPGPGSGVQEPGVLSGRGGRPGGPRRCLGPTFLLPVPAPPGWPHGCGQKAGRFPLRGLQRCPL